MPRITDECVCFIRVNYIAGVKITGPTVSKLRGKVAFKGGTSAVSLGSVVEERKGGVFYTAPQYF